MRHWLQLSLAALGLGLACVPATDEGVQPRGAGGLVINPTPESAGTPFVTSDGWTIQVHSFVVYAEMQLSSAAPENGAGGYASALFRADKSISVFARALAPLEYRAQVYVGYRTAGYDESQSGLEVFGDHALLPRFLEEADDNTTHPCDQLPGCDSNAGCDLPDGVTSCGSAVAPSLQLELTATKDGRSEHLAFALSGGFSGYDGDAGAPVTVVADSLHLGTATLDVKKIFTNDLGEVVFDDIAAADTNGDGTISFAELHAATRDIVISVGGDGYATIPADAVPVDELDGGAGDAAANAGDSGDSDAGTGFGDAGLGDNFGGVFDDGNPPKDTYRVPLSGILQARFDKLFSYP